MKRSLLLGLSAISMLLLASCASSSSSMLNNSLFPSSQLSGQNVTMYSLNDPAFWQGSSDTIWARLKQTGLDKLQANQNTPDTTQAGWIKLAIIGKRYSTNTTELIHQLEAWRSQYSGHPGNNLFPDNATLNNYLAISPPKHIALLLPLSGKLSTSGNAVRNGFMNAYYTGKGSANQTVSFYDTNQNPNVGALYQQAIAKGADTILGPLTKEDAKKLLSHGTSVPTIELNYTDSWGSLPNNIYQFGLSPIDESKQVANKAAQSGYKHALLIAPKNDWGQKTADSISQNFKNLGGTIVDTYYYASTSNFSVDIPHFLQIDPKHDQKISHDPKRKAEVKLQGRHDYDVIFLLAPPTTARQIVPLLRFYYITNKTPIYATSAVYSGNANPALNNDLNGVVFCDSPSTLYEGGNRLSSVGHDAYLISRDLWRFRNLPNFPLYGATGEITLSNGNQFYRRLAWAQFHNGSA